MADPYNSTTKTTTTGQVPPTNTSTTHVRETQSSTNWFAYLLAGAVIAVGIGALVYGTSDDTVGTAPGTATESQPAGGNNNVTIEAPATAPAPAPTAPAADAPAATAPATAPAPAPAEPAAPAPAPDAAPAPAGN